MHKTKPVLKADAKYKSLYGASVSIAREEGVRALWKGHVSGQCLSVILASVQFGLYQALWQRAAANGEFCLLLLWKVLLSRLFFGQSFGPLQSPETPVNRVFGFQIEFFEFSGA